MFEMPLRPFRFFQPKYEAEIHLDRSYCEKALALHGDSKGATGLALKNGKKNATNSGWSKLIGFKFGHLRKNLWKQGKVTCRPQLQPCDYLKTDELTFQMFKYRIAQMPEFSSPAFIAQNPWLILKLASHRPCMTY